MRGWIVLSALAVTGTAHAFCGFYVAGADTELFNEATMVVMMRHGTTTVLSMQNDYKGPPEDFAMVVPVPVVLEEEDVRTLPHHVFARIDQMAAPRLVEYWEQDPCARPPRRHGRGGGGLRRRASMGSAGAPSGALPPPLVRIEAEFSVEEYEIVILSADDSSALEGWLRANGYNIPEGAAEALRPYIEQEMKFFVAKVDTEKVEWEGTGRERHAVLSPLRMAYESESFSLPVRLGMLNSSGTQDLIVHILAEQQRYEVANMPNVTIPTNIVVRDATRRRFGSFYAALFDRSIAETGAVVTEYSWQASSCDPCPGPQLRPEDFNAVGADQIDFESTAARTPYWQTEVETLNDQMPELLSQKLALASVLEQCHRQAFSGHASDVVAGRIRLRVDTTATPPVTVDADTFVPEQGAALRTCIDERLAQVTMPQSGVFAGVAEFEARAAAPPAGGRLRNLVLTRLHYRYDADDLADDLVFRPAPPIVGGRGVPHGAEGTMGDEVRESSSNTFQGRYVILHPWARGVRCDQPNRGRWGGPVRDTDRRPVEAARNLGHVRRGGVRLDRLIAASALPAILPTPEVVAGYGQPAAERDIALPIQPPAPEATPRADIPPSEPRDGCNCASAPLGAASLMLPLLALVALRRLS